MARVQIGLKRGVALFALAAIVLPLLILGYLFISYHERTTIADITSENMRLAAAVRSDVSNFLDIPLKTVSAVAILANDPAFSPHINALLSRMVENYGYFESIMVLDHNGVIRNVGASPTKGLQREEYLGLDLSAAEHVARARLTKQYTWSDTYISPLSGEPTLSLTMPFKAGMVIGNFNLGYLRSIVTPPLPQAHDRVLLVNSKGRIIAHPDHEKVLQQVNVGNLSAVQAGRQGREGVYEYDAEGISYLGAVLVVPGTEWLVIVERTRDEVFAAMRVMQRVLVLSIIIAMLFIIFLISYVNARIVRPVIAISAATKSIVGGSFQALQKYQGYFAELREVTTNFITMSAALQEREQALADKNRELEREVTRRIRSEQEALQSEAKLKMILENAPFVVYILGLDGKGRYVNRTLEMTTGYNSEELLKKNFLEFVHPEDREAVIRRHKARLAGKPVESRFIVRILDKSDNVVWAENHVIMITWEGQPALLNAFQDITERKRAEMELQESKQFSDVLLESLPGIFFFYEIDAESPGRSRLLRFNRNHAELTGYSADELRRMTVADWFEGDMLEKAVEAIREGAKGGVVQVQLDLRMKDGTKTPYFFTGRTLLKGMKPCFLGVGIDVSDYIRIQDALHKSEELFRIAFWTNPDAIIISRIQDGVMLDVNKGFTELVGYTREEALNRDATRDLNIWAVHEDRQNFIEELRTKGMIDNLETQFRRKDGTVISGSVSARVIMLNDVPHILSIGKDITGRKRAEEEREKLIADIRHALADVSRSQKEWQDTFDNITDMISIHDRDYTVIRANKAFSQNLGLQPNEVIGRKCHELMHGGAASPLAGCPHQRTMEDGKQAAEEVYDSRTGRTLQVTTFPYVSPDGSIIGSIHIGRDITEEKEREMKMIMTERLASLGQMASGIAHEINNPLASVMICSEMLLMKVAKDQYDHAQFEKYLRTIDEEVQRCRDITANMLSFTRQTSMEQQAIDVQELLDKAVDLVGFQGRLKNVEVRKHYGPKVLVQGNEGELRQVFLALIVNALDAVENKGVLTLEAGQEGSFYRVRISDTGPGIPEDIQQKIFQPFFTTKSGSGGTGLGLSIAHRIVTNHQGALDVTSEPGSGATFTISLPC